MRRGRWNRARRRFPVLAELLRAGPAIIRARRLREREQQGSRQKNRRQSERKDPFSAIWMQHSCFLPEIE
jgi:hypothetical protein